MTLNSMSSNGALNYRMLRIATEKYGVLPDQLDSQQKHEVDSVAAKEVIMERAVLSSKEAQNVVISPEQIERAVAEIKNRYEQEEQFFAAMDNSGLDEEKLREALEREIKVEAVLDWVSHEVPDVDDTEVTLFYYLHQSRFQNPERRTARHILVTINPDFPENTREAARERIELISERLKKDVRRFSDQAIKHSECPTGLNGGLLGDIPKDTLYPELDAVLFTMQPGEISSVVESEVGFHILLCEAIQPEETVAIDSVKEKLREQLTQRQRSRHQKRWLRSILSA